MLSIANHIGHASAIKNIKKKYERKRMKTQPVIVGVVFYESLI